MRKLTYYLPALLLLQFCTAPVFAQNAVFLKEGSIQYERRTNGYALMQEMSEAGGLTGDKVDQYKIKNPQFRMEYFNLSFKDNKTRFEPADANAGQPASMDEWFSLVAAGNTVYSDLSSGKRVSLKKVFGNQYEESDSIRAIKWKIADETRDIAGFHCRRADAVINDSLYIVAFYSTEIPVSGGPE
ncbi:MAG TPA: GLPGLI family protein, partial [Puia sp.]|nr:GLPGLI family protein [Puia sp.]